MDSYEKALMKILVEMKCEWCRKKYSTDVLHVHHINGKRDDNRESNLVVLCPTHHALAHNKDQKRITPDRLRTRVKNRAEWRKKMIRQLIKNGFTKFIDLASKEK